MLNILLRSPLFVGVKSEEIETIFDGVPFQVRSYNKGQVIALRESKCDQLMIVVEGSVKGEMLDFSGKVIKIDDIVAPNAAASAFVFGNKNVLPVDVIATSECKIMYIPKDSILKLFQRSPVFLNNYLNDICNKTQFLSSKLWILSFKSIRGKLAQFILQAAKPDKVKITLPKSQKELSEFFGVTRPSLARVLNELQEEKVIEYKNKDITILNRPMLMKMLE